MKKILTLILSFMMMATQAQAATGNENGLKNAFDELSYSLNVEWDQKDKSFYDQQSEKFEQTILTLKAQGMTNEELLNFVLTNVKDENAKNDLKQVYAIASNENLSRSEMEQLTQEVLNRHYQKGSSWIGAVIITGVVLIIIITAVTSAILLDAQNNPSNCKYDYVCDASNNCSFTNYHCY